MKTLEFIYEEAQIHFLVNPLDKNVMVNATEMAKLFGKKTEKFLKSDHAKAFIEIANRHPNGGRIIDSRGRNGVFFDQRLALKFASWLDPEFEFWVYSKIHEILFGNYKKHWDAHVDQEIARIAMADIKTEILMNPTPENVAEYFRHETDFKRAGNLKKKVIRNQYKLFEFD